MTRGLVPAALLVGLVGLTFSHHGRKQAFVTPGVHASLPFFSNPAAVKVPLPSASQPGAFAVPSLSLVLAAVCVAVAVRPLRAAVALRAAKRSDRVAKTQMVESPKIPDLPTQWNDSRLGYRIKGAPGMSPFPHGKTLEPMRWVSRFATRIRIRERVVGTPSKPRMAVFRSLGHIYVNVVDDTQGFGVILANDSTRKMKNLQTLRAEQGCKLGRENTWSVAAAELIGKELAKQCLEKGITAVVFDRGGFYYGGRIRALKEAASAAGLQIDNWRPDEKNIANGSMGTGQKRGAVKASAA